MNPKNNNLDFNIIRKATVTPTQNDPIKTYEIIFNIEISSAVSPLSSLPFDDT